MTPMPLPSFPATPARRGFAGRVGLLGVLVALLAPAGPAGAQDLAYTHNGSGMVVSRSGADLRITYADPRAGLRAEGVAPGTLLFSGRVENGYIEGMAAIFRAGCGRLDYFVYGDDRPGRDFTLSGAAPVLAPQGCAVVDNVYEGPNAVLVFEVAGPSASPAPLPAQAGTPLCVVGVAPGSILNLRLGPGTEHGAIAEIPAGACDLVAGPVAERGWQALRWRDRRGWASARFLAPAR